MADLDRRQTTFQRWAAVAFALLSVACLLWAVRIKELAAQAALRAEAATAAAATETEQRGREINALRTELQTEREQRGRELDVVWKEVALTRTYATELQVLLLRARIPAPAPPWTERRPPDAQARENP